MSAQSPATFPSSILLHLILFLEQRASNLEKRIVQLHNLLLKDLWARVGRQGRLLHERRA